MNESVPVILRLIAASIPVANQAGKIIRDVMKAGELNIVDKVIFTKNHVFSVHSFYIFCYVRIGYCRLSNAS